MESLQDREKALAWETGDVEQYASPFTLEPAHHVIKPVGESPAAAPAAPLLCHTCGTILDPNWLNCPKCEGKARSTPVEKSALDTTTNEV
jgi:hypothetical protein